MLHLKLQGLFEKVRLTGDPASGPANETLIQLVRRGDRGFRFRSLEQARSSRNIALLLDMDIAVWEERKIARMPLGGIVRWSEGTKKTLGRH